MHYLLFISRGKFAQNFSRHYSQVDQNVVNNLGTAVFCS